MPIESIGNWNIAVGLSLISGAFVLSAHWK
jgi:hypothetical protein